MAGDGMRDETVDRVGQPDMDVGYTKEVRLHFDYRDQTVAIKADCGSMMVIMILEGALEVARHLYRKEFQAMDKQKGTILEYGQGAKGQLRGA